MNPDPEPVTTDPVTPDAVTPDPVTADPVTPAPVVSDPVIEAPVTDPVADEPTTDPVTDELTTDPVTPDADPDPVASDPDPAPAEDPAIEPGFGLGSEGRVLYAPRHDPQFDGYTRAATPEQQQWINAHWDRGLVFSSYAATYLPYFANGWVYKNSYAIKPSWTVYQQHPEWVLRDASGNQLYIDFACSGGTCPQYAADIGNPDWVAWWLEDAAAWLAQSGYAGLWVDDVNMDWRISNGNGDRVLPIDPRTGQTMTLTDWRRYMAEFMEAIRARFPNREIVHNSIWFIGDAQTDPYIRRQIQAADIFTLERGGADATLHGGTGQYAYRTWLTFVDYVHGLGTSVYLLDYPDTPKQRDFGVATYLLVSEGADYVGSDRADWSLWDNWYAGYGADLGPAYTARYEQDGVLRRDFQCGMTLVNPPHEGAKTTTIPPGYSTFDGTPVGTSITLADWEGRVLTRPCQ